MPLGSAWPEGVFRHRPEVGAQLRHAPAQELSQQTLSTHTVPAAHWLPPEQLLPSGFIWQVPLTHVFGAVHWLSLLQELLQAAPEHFPAPQLVAEPTALQAPAPLHSYRGICWLVAESHDCALHPVPALYLLQAPAPSQVESVPQEAAP